MAKKRRIGFKKIPLERILAYIIVTLFLIFIWSAVAVILKVLTFIYFIYRLINATFDGFSNTLSVAHLFISLILVALAFIISTKAFLVLIIILMWINAFLDD